MQVWGQIRSDWGLHRAVGCAAACAAWVGVVVGFPGEASGNPTEMIRFHGVVTQLNGLTPADGTYSFRLEIFNVATGGTALISRVVSAPIIGKTYTVELTPQSQGELLSALGDGPRFLQTTVVSGPSGAINQVLQPRHEIASVPFAISAGNQIPAGAIILWDQATGCNGAALACPCGFLRAVEFDGVLVRGAATAPGGAIPPTPGVKCPGGASCTAAADHYDDDLEVAELATHGHPTMVYTSGANSWSSNGPGGFPTGTNSNDSTAFPANAGAPGMENGMQIGGEGGGQPHYHPFRTVLFCRRQ